MTRSAFFEKLNSIEIRRRLLDKELTDVYSSISQQEKDDFYELKDGLRHKVSILSEEFIKDKNMDLLLSDSEFSHAVYVSQWSGNDVVYKKLSEFKSSIPYVKKDGGSHVYDREMNLVINIFFVAIPCDADPVKLDELAEKLDKVFRVQREILSGSKKEPYIRINSDPWDGIYYYEDRKKPYSVTGSEGEYETLRQALEVVREIKPYKAKQSLITFNE